MAELRFRPGSRRRARIATGVGITALAVGGNVLVYSSLDDSAEVLQFTSNVHAGDLIEVGDVRIVDVDADLAVTDLVPADQAGLIVGRYARTFIPARALASEVMVRSTPLVTPGAAVVAVEPSGRLLPRGTTERSRVWLVIGDGEERSTVEARVVALNRDEGGDTGLSVEVAEADAALVASADELHVVLLDAGIDPAVVGGDGS